MLLSLSALRNYSLYALDGPSGRITDFYFDEEKLFIRFAVVVLGSWLFPEHKLIPVSCFGHAPIWARKDYPVLLRKEQIEACPDSSHHKPLSERKSTALYAQLGYPAFSPAVSAQAAALQNEMSLAKGNSNQRNEGRQPDDRDLELEDRNLRSLKEVTGYHVKSKEDEFGHLEDIIVDTRNWTIRHLIVNTRNWLPAKSVFIPPKLVNEFDWMNKQMKVDMTKEEIEQSPEYDPTRLVNREIEARLYDFHGKPQSGNTTLMRESPNAPLPFP